MSDSWIDGAGTGTVEAEPESTTGDDDPAIDPGSTPSADDPDDPFSENPDSDEVWKAGVVVLVPAALCLLAIGTAWIYQWHPVAGVVGLVASLVLAGYVILRRL